MKEIREIKVSDHAVERFKQRCFKCYNWPEEKIRQRLETIARKGKVIKKCPGNAFEVMFENMIIRTAVNNDKVVVITCLGSKSYRNWYRKAG